MERVNWGIIGCGRIAANFSESLEGLEMANLVAVASRTEGKAQSFAEKHGVDLYYHSYEELLNNTDIDVVYVATTHNFHYENVLLCLEYGKNVLCEKIFTINAKQASHLRDVAKEKGLFLMEAMWTRFLPSIREVRKIIDQGVIGDIMFLEAEFSFVVPMDPEGRFYNRNLAGGSLMDQGIYPISFASMLFGKQPDCIKTNSCQSSTGVDVRSTHIFEYGRGRAAMINTSIAYYSRKSAIIAGTEGSIEIQNFFHSKEFTLKAGDRELKYSLPFESTGKGYEAQEVMDCIRAGKRQSDIMPIDESVAIMETIDKIREMNGLVFPDEMEASI